jgi:hypothetical protein
MKPTKLNKILITDKLLVEFGFIKNNFSFTKEDINIRKYCNTWLIYISVGVFNYSLCKVEYVCELQNFFSDIKKELSL